MKKTLFDKYLLFTLLFISSSVVIAKAQKAESNKLQQVYELLYIEREQGVDEYETIMLVSDRYIRIDEQGEDSGFIIYDDKKKTIFSVSHQDQLVLVIKEFTFKEKDSPVKHEVEYLQLADAPTISGKNIFNYRVYTGKENEETCIEVQLVENLLPEVTSMLKSYQKIVSGQQVKMTDNKINDMQTPCYFVDQIYNTGAYYEKGLPVQEWHSNEHARILTSYKKTSVNIEKFTIPENYRQFSIGNRSGPQSLDNLSREALITSGSNRL